jgi:dienelactone hydrolase
MRVKIVYVSMLMMVHMHIFVQQKLCCVQSTLLHLIDESRKEFYTNDSLHPWRELMVRVWYPHDNNNVNMISDAQQQYPVLIFSHGLGGAFNGSSYAALCQACVKAGYIVVSISHSYACKPIQFSDGRMTTYCFGEVSRRYLSGQEMESWEADCEYVIDWCGECARDQHSLLYNRLDVDKIGMLGHSYGGAVAVQMCRKDARIKAAINLDGPLRGENSTIPFNKPLFFIIAAALPHTIPLITHPLLANDLGWSYAMHSQEIFAINALGYAMNGNFYKIILDGIRHTTFSDEIFNQHTPLDNTLIDPQVAHAIISKHIIDFFDLHVKGFSYE